jgi:chitinase
MNISMNRNFRGRLIGILIIGSCIGCSCQEREMQISRHKNDGKQIWATGYFPGWRHTDQAISFLKKDDYAFLTHLIHFGGMPNPDGSIDVDRLNVGSASRKLAVEAAHAAGKPILFCVVGEYPLFNPVIENAQIRHTFINNLLSIMTESGYDGIDLDMEPVCAPFGSFGYQGVDLGRYPEYKTEFPVNHAYVSLVKELRRELDKQKTPLFERPLLTAAITWRDCHIFGRTEVHACFDQINLMTYNMSGPQDGDVTWFDSPLYNGGFIFPKYNMPAYSIEMFVNDGLEAGIPAEKLGIGICLDALVWKGGEGVAITSGVTRPRQTWTFAPSHPHQGDPRYTYAEMLHLFYHPENYHWDEVAQVPYLSIDLPGSSGDLFISFNDERSVNSKIDFIKKKGLGGFIIWELSADYRPDQAEENQRPLRKAMQEALQSQPEVNEYEPTPN